MKPQAIRKAFRHKGDGERGVTMIIVALAMVAIIGMAALSIDVITLYLAREEAQRSADSAALAAAKIISLSGLTGDPANSAGNWGKVCGPDDGTNGLATRTAKAVAGQDTVGSIVATTINVTYSAGNGGAVGAGTSDCSSLSATAFGVNPMVTVQLTRAGLPSFFSRIWGNTGNSIGATATAEAFNSSNSGNVGNQVTGTITPAQPRCVKPWAVPNIDPHNPESCNGTCAKFVQLGDGSITNKGMSLGGLGTNGAVGENFWLLADCHRAQPGCVVRAAPQANYNPSPATPPAYLKGPPNLTYLPGQVNTTPLAVPSCSSGSDFENAITGCDQPTNYSCGLPPAGNPNPNVIDLTNNPDTDTINGVKCLTRQTNAFDTGSSSGQDYLNAPAFGEPSSYPYQMLAGTANPIGTAGASISNSASIVSLPIFDEGPANITSLSTGRIDVTFVGFLQVFINAVDRFGNINVTVLNVVGCSNGSGSPVGASQIGDSPVPVRLITPP
jgi:hypothetical protein